MPNMTLLLFPSLASTLGATYLGGIGAAMLFGATNIQVYFYFRNYSQDKMAQKCAVIFLWILDMLHMAVAIAELWHYLIDDFGNYLALELIDWSPKAQSLITIITILSVQSLYTVRIWKISQDQNRIWPWLLSILLMTGYATGTILIVKMFEIVTFDQLQDIRWAIYLSLAMSSLHDVLLTIGMCHLLYLGTKMFAATKSMVGTIIRYVIVSGALTSTCSLAALISFLAMPDNFVFLGIAFVFTKLYINSYLAMLNARESLRNSVVDAEQLSDIEIGYTDTQRGPSTETIDHGARDKGAKVDVNIVHQ